VFGGRQGQRPPVGNPTSIVCHGLMDKAGVSFPEAHLDARAMADLAVSGSEVLGFDTLMPEYSVVQEAAALGAQVDWGDRDKMPDVKVFPNPDFADIVIPKDFLEKPSCRVVLDAISILRHQVGGRVAIIGKVMGPWTLSYHMAGTQNFLLALGMGEKAKVTKMLRQLMPVTIAFINAQFCAGADIVVLADHATGNLIGPYHYEEHLLPIHQEITAQVWSFSLDRGWTVTTSNGRSTPGKPYAASEMKSPWSAISTTRKLYCKGRPKMFINRRGMRSRPGCTSSHRSAPSRLPRPLRTCGPSSKRPWKVIEALIERYSIRRYWVFSYRP
jgi:uroporphyrinogen-III decarboxylase